MNKDKRELLAGYVDGELTPEEKKLFESMLAEDPQLKAELEDFMNIQNITGLVKYDDLPEEVWESYWESLYKKTERSLGWIFFSIGAIVTLCFILFQAFQQMHLDTDTSLIIKISVTVLTMGLVILLISFVRERLFAYKRDRYREVNR